MIDWLKKKFRGRSNSKKLLAATRPRIERIMKKGPWPYRLVFCEHEDGRLLTLDNVQQDERALLLFTSPYHAGDYLMHTNTTARLYGVRAESLPIEVAKWLGKGFRRFTLDKCPRCPVVTSIRMGTLSRREDFVKTWAIHRVTRAIKGEELTLQAVARFKEGNLRATFETLCEIRDHVECALPNLYYLIAIMAGILELEDEQRTALSLLQTFEGFDAQPLSGVETLGAISAALYLDFHNVGR